MNASPRELERVRQQILWTVRESQPGLSDADAARIADTELDRLRRKRGDVIAAAAEIAPTFSFPRRDRIVEDVRLAACLAQEPVARLNALLAHTPSRRGPTHDLSGAVAALNLMAASTGPNHLTAAMAALHSGSAAARWALGHPGDADYRRVHTVCGRPPARAGHDPQLMLLANRDLVRAIAALRNPDGTPVHPRFGAVGIVDATRLRAPVVQHGYNNDPGMLAALLRPGMELVRVSTYERGGQRDTIIGWKALTIIDQATGLPLAWVFGEATLSEHRILMTRLLDDLFDLFPELPMHTIVGDGSFDNEETCRTLSEDYSLHPVFTRTTKRTAVRTLRGGRTVRVVDGQPECACGPMKLHRREGFYASDDRLRDGLLRGQKAPNVKAARLRWRCPSNLHPEVSLFCKDDPASHTYWPRGGMHPADATRRAFELSRQQVENVFSQVKLCGIGDNSRDSLWARDTGTKWLLGMHYVLRTAWALASSNGHYHMLEAEYRALGMHKAGSAPTNEQLLRACAARPPALVWEWPTPGSRLHALPAAA